MQQQQQRSNLLNWVVFFLLAFLIMTGWNALMRYWFPPPAQQQVTPVWTDVGKLPPQQQAEASGRLALAAAPIGSGIGSAYQAAGSAAIADWLAQHPGQPAPKPKPAPVVKEKPAPRHDGIVMGGKDYPMTVKFTTHGAAVQQLVLNHFQQTTEMGLSAHEELTLIPDDPNHGSELLYHYPKPDSEYPVTTLGKKEWEIVPVKSKDGKSGTVATADDGTESIQFTTTIPDMPVRITKTFTLRPGDYHLGLAVKFERTNNEKTPLKVRYQLAGAHGLPIEGVWYTYTYRNAMIGTINGTHVSRNLQDSGSIAYKEGGEQILAQGGDWIEYGAVANQYFTSAIVVNNEQDQGIDRQNLIAWARPTVEPDMTPLGGKIYPDKEFLQDITVRLVSQPVSLRAGEPIVHRYVLYNGPVKVRLLKDLEPQATPTIDWYENTLHLNTFTDVPSPATPGWLAPWSALLVWTTNLMHSVLWGMHHVIPNYGICIILMTLLVRICIYPLSRRQAIASAKMQAKMQALKPEMTKLEEKYRNNPEELRKAKLELQLKSGAHPLAMMGSCWVMSIQMPIFLGLYYALQESIHFRLASFLWMPSLAAPDMLFSWGTHIPLISDWANLRGEPWGGIIPVSLLYLGPYLNLLPIIAVIIMTVQQAMMAPPATDEQTAQQQKMMKYMSVFIGFFFYKFASGVALYYIVSSLWGVLERKFLPKKSLEPAAATVGGKVVTPAAARKNRNGRAQRQEDGRFQKVRDFWQKVLKEAKKK